MIRFIFSLLKRKEKKELPDDFIELLEKNGYVSLKEWREKNDRDDEDYFQDYSKRE